ncbi:MAG: type II toxin-antitoxin system RelE/ParE family toxin [Candidatus Caenarcaniphilales bacterium]|nr:type II toxin-antitoxin system RelE/ParE family toxin [Candidatus Caenarcaniphilales bacterium]
MEEKNKLSIKFFAENSGKEPVREWLHSLPKIEKKIIGSDIKTIQFSWPIGMPIVRSLKNGLWEVRSSLPNRIARVIFMIVRDEVILLHGFIKKTKKTTAEDMQIAVKRKKAIQRGS